MPPRDCDCEQTVLQTIVLFFKEISKFAKVMFFLFTPYARVHETSYNLPSPIE